MSKDNKYIISASEDRSIKVIDLETKAEVHQFQDADCDIRMLIRYILELKLVFSRDIFIGNVNR